MRGLGYRDSIDPQVSLGDGTFGFRRLFGATSAQVGGGQVLAALELQHYDGPFVTPDDARKVNTVLRYSDGNEHDGYSVTAMYYHQLWTNTTDIPVRAIGEGASYRTASVPSIPPTVAARSACQLFSAELHQRLGAGEFSSSAYLIYNELQMYNDFTHDLVDPLHGDQGRRSPRTATCSVPPPTICCPSPTGWARTRGRCRQWAC